MGEKIVPKEDKVAPFRVGALEHMQMVRLVVVWILYKIVPAGDALLTAKSIAERLQVRNQSERATKILYSDAEVENRLGVKLGNRGAADMFNRQNSVPQTVLQAPPFGLEQLIPTPVVRSEANRMLLESKRVFGHGL